MTLESRREWVVKKPEKKKKKTIFNGYNMASVLEDILWARGLITSDSLLSFLSPDLSSIPESSQLHGSTEAAEKIINAIKAGKKIFIHGDFDVDGVCATNILWDFLYNQLPSSDKEMTLKSSDQVLPYIPSRVDEGYGLSDASIQAMIDAGAELIITVDCGVRDKELIKKYIESHKLDFIITDHHQPPEDIEEDLNYTVVHQMFPGSEFPYQKVCGAFIALLLVQAIKSLRSLDNKLTINTPGLDLAALATVADMMPLENVNRTIVKFGLEQMRNSNRSGLKSLAEVAKFNLSEINSYHLGYVIGPRINAAGRLGNAIDALKLLSTQDKAVSDRFAKKLDSLNMDRQRMTTEILNQAKEQIKSAESDDKLIFVSGDNWPEGIIGLVAGKLIESTGKPSIVVTEKSEIKGSARSVPSFNITSAIEKFADKLERYGGHAQAAGFTVKEGKLQEFKNLITEYANSELKDEDFLHDMEIDGIIDSENVSLSFIEEFEKLEPFGYGNRKPLFAIMNTVVVDKFILSGGKHLKLSVKGSGLELITAMMFDCAEDVEIISVDDVIDIAGYLATNTWKDVTSPQFQVKEWRRSKPNLI